jgi:hypothetical protein
MKQTKAKLKRRGTELYNKYFFNPKDILLEIITHYDNGLTINDNECEVVFNTQSTSLEQIYEIIMYYPNLLKEKKIITDDIIKDIYSIYGETIDIMNSSKGANVRGKIISSSNARARMYNLPANIISEDITLVRMCPLLNVPLEYGNHLSSPYSASLDRIEPNKGYIKGNIQVISMLANQMKSSANKTELLTFANNIIKLYG